MSTPLAKRRRLDAESTLSKPFRSPFKTPLKTDSGTNDENTSEAPGEELPLRHKTSSLLNSSSTPIMNKPLRQLGSKILTPTSRLPRPSGFSSPFRSTPILSAVDPEIAELMKKQRELEKTLREVKEELDTAEQASKIERKSGEGEVDGELKGLVGKWKGATRRAAEDLFGGVRDRINKAGGPRAWKEAAKAAQEAQAAWEAEGRELERLETEKALGNSDDDASDEDDDEEEKAKKRRRREIRREIRDAAYDSCNAPDDDPGDYETELERLQRVPGNVAVNDDEIEDEYTMAEMLKTLNIPIEVIGYDMENQIWVD